MRHPDVDHQESTHPVTGRSLDKRSSLPWPEGEEQKRKEPGPIGKHQNNRFSPTRTEATLRSYSAMFESVRDQSTVSTGW